MVQRREFIKKSLAGTAGIAAGSMVFNARSYASIMGANERINAAVIGIGGRGRDLIGEVCKLKDDRNIRLVTICDVDEKFFAERNKEVLEKTGIQPKNEWDMRRIFDDKEIHAVWFATPNFWHALGTIWACQAGKHVYVEKPCSYNVFEGRKMIEASRKYNVRVQVGLQSRSSDKVQAAIRFLHGGGIGEVFMARGLCLKPRKSFGIAKDGTPPDSLHYDMWLGPAEYQAYNEKKVHYNWHWHWNTGNGDTGNQGPHQFDVARWGLGKNEHPVSVYSTGGIFGWGPDECSQETPDTQSSLFKYKDGKILEFETRGRDTNVESSLGIRIGNLFYGTEGHLELDNSGEWAAFRNDEKEPFAGSGQQQEAGAADPTFMKAAPATGHSANFIDAIRAGNSQGLACDIREGHYSCVLPHLANISCRLGRDLKFMGDYEQFAGDDEADRMLTRNYRKPYVISSEV
jgi:predicted dehydrogenase